MENNIIKDLIEFDPLTGNKVISLEGTVIYPAKHYMTDPRTYNDVFKKLEKTQV